MATFLSDAIMDLLKGITFSPRESQLQPAFDAYGYCSDGSCSGDCVGGCEGTPRGSYGSPCSDGSCRGDCVGGCDGTAAGGW